MQLAAMNEELNFRPKLAPLDNNTKATRLSKIPLTKPPAMAKLPRGTTLTQPLKPTTIEGELRTKQERTKLTKKAPELTKYSRTALERAKTCQGQPELTAKPAKLDRQEEKAENRGEETVPLYSQGHHKEGASKIGATKEKDRALITVSRALSLKCQQHKYRDFHSLGPDNVTNLHSMPELWSSKELKDPQQCTEYVKDIYENLLAAERDQVHKTIPSVLTLQTEVGENHRRVLVDWLIQVHTKFELLPDTLHICIDILDRYLQVKSSSTVHTAQETS